MTQTGLTSRKDWQRLHNTAAWKRLRARQLKLKPMCQCPHCKEKGRPATVVDHIVAHKGDRKLFFDKNNLQSMAKPCHDKFKQSEETGGHGFDMGCDAAGEPLSKDHPWYG